MKLLVSMVAFCLVIAGFGQLQGCALVTSYSSVEIVPQTGITAGSPWFITMPGTVDREVTVPGFHDREVTRGPYRIRVLEAGILSKPEDDGQLSKPQHVELVLDGMRQEVTLDRHGAGWYSEPIEIDLSGIDTLSVEVLAPTENNEAQSGNDNATVGEKSTPMLVHPFKVLRRSMHGNRWWFALVSI